MNNTDIFTVVGKSVGTMLRQNSKHTDTLAALPRTVEGTVLLAFQHTCSPVRPKRDIHHTIQMTLPSTQIKAIYMVTSC